MRAIIFATAAVFSVASLAVADVTDGVYRVASEHPTQAPRALRCRCRAAPPTSCRVPG
jgi:hypothetical protein